MKLSPVPHVVYSDFGVSRIKKDSANAWTLNLALQSIPTIMCNGDAFSDDDFQMMDTDFGRLLAFRLRPGTYEVTVENQILDGVSQMICRNYPDGGTNEDFQCSVSSPYARFCTIASDGSLTAFDDSSEAIEILDDLWATWILYRIRGGADTIGSDELLAEFQFRRSGSGSYEPHVGTTRFVGSVPTHATHEAPNVMDITYTKANVIQSKNRVV